MVDLARHRVGVTAEAARDPLSEGGEKSQRPGSQSGQGFQFGVQKTRMRRIGRVLWISIAR